MLRAGGASPEQAQAALDSSAASTGIRSMRSCRRKGHGPEDASDLTQDFFAVARQ